MPLTKGELIKMLQDDKSPMDTLIGVHLDCTNDDASMNATNLTEANYCKFRKQFVIFGDYRFEEY